MVVAMSPATEREAIDGRRARGERTRVRVLEALLGLVEEGQLRPTASEVAERAGVALRTVYHHFEDVESLRQMALDEQLARHTELLSPIDQDSSVHERISILVRQLRKLYEAISPIRRATLFDEQISEEIAEGLKRARSVRREHLENTFAEELTNQGKDRVLLDAADTATSWQTWDYLRSGLRRSAGAAERVVIYALQELFTTGTSRRQR